jgi:NADP-dependent 3-hydroxy acid dehydrogenase YdfG
MKIIVTGASRGIGRGIASVLGREGVHVGALARSRDKLESLSDQIVSAGGRCAVADADLRDVESASAAIAALIEEMGGVDGLVNNAGLVIRKDAMSISLDEWHAMVETNINGLFYATRSVLPHLVEQKSGHIVNVSSISGYYPLKGGSAYAATKYAVTGFSESLFQEVREHGIKVTTVFPGSVDSASHRHEDQDSSWKVQPEEVGDAVLGLLRTRDGNVISRLEIRPLGRPPTS